MGKEEYRPFGISHVPYHVRFVIIFAMQFYGWFRRQHPTLKQFESDLFPLLVWEDRNVRGTFDFDFVGIKNLHIVMDDPVDPDGSVKPGRCVEESGETRIHWIVTSVTVKYDDSSTQTWEGDELAKAVASFLPL